MQIKTLVQQVETFLHEIRAEIARWRVKIHFNPRGLLGYDDLKSWSSADKLAQEYSVKGAAAAITSLTVRYFDTVQHYDSAINGTEVVGQLYKVLAMINEQ
jgi:hypothetical protein